MTLLRDSSSRPTSIDVPKGYEFTQMSWPRRLGRLRRTRCPERRRYHEAVLYWPRTTSGRCRHRHTRRPVEPVGIKRRRASSRGRRTTRRFIARTGPVFLKWTAATRIPQRHFERHAVDRALRRSDRRPGGRRRWCVLKPGGILVLATEHARRDAARRGLSAREVQASSTGQPPAGGADDEQVLWRGLFGCGFTRTAFRHRTWSSAWARRCSRRWCFWKRSA